MKDFQEVSIRTIQGSDIPHTDINPSITDNEENLHRKHLIHRPLKITKNKQLLSYSDIEYGYRVRYWAFATQDWAFATQDWAFSAHEWAFSNRYFFSVL